MSVRWMRSAVISNGRFLEAVAWSKETTSFVEKKFGTGKIETWVDAFGQVGSIRWSIDFPDLATVEKVQAQMLMDQDYWKHVERAAKAQLFIDGSTVDTISRSV